MKSAKSPKNQVNIKEDSSRVTLLMAVGYKGGMIYVRKIGDDMYMWDVVFNNELYSSYMIITPTKDHLTLTENELAEVVKMCYAGAAATVDFQRGDKVSKTQKELVKTFEASRKKVKMLN